MEGKMEAGSEKRDQRDEQCVEILKCRMVMQHVQSPLSILTAKQESNVSVWVYAGTNSMCVWYRKM